MRHIGIIQNRVDKKINEGKNLMNFQIAFRIILPFLSCHPVVWLARVILKIKAAFLNRDVAFLYFLA